MENKIGEIVTLPFCDIKARVEESPRYRNPLNLLISRCEGCYYENQEDVCEDCQDYGALGECYHICREDQKDIIFKPLSEDNSATTDFNQSCNQDTAPINHVETIEERASIYAHTEWTSEFTDVAKESYIKGATEQKAIDEEIRLKRSDDMTQAEYDREVAFADWYHQNRKGTPTFSDAIEWAREDLLNEVCRQVLSLKQ